VNRNDNGIFVHGASVNKNDNGIFAHGVSVNKNDNGIFAHRVPVNKNDNRNPVYGVYWAEIHDVFWFMKCFDEKYTVYFCFRSSIDEKAWVHFGKNIKHH
jgi:hypothetical protein